MKLFRLCAAVLILAACSHGSNRVTATRAQDSSSEPTTTTQRQNEAAATTSTSTTAPPSTAPTQDTVDAPTSTTVEEPTSTTIEPSASGPRLLYMGRAAPDGDDPLDVWSAALDGTDRRLVASGVPVKVDVYHPSSLSFDGRRLAYVHRDDHRVHVRQLDDGTDIAVSIHPSYQAGWLDDATLVYGNEDDSSTWLVQADGANERRLASASLYGTTYDHRAIVARDQQTEDVITSDGITTTVTAHEAAVLGGVVAPNGEHIAWAESTGCRCPSVALWIARPDGSDARKIFGDDSYFGRNSPSWADDETVFSSRPEVAIDRMTLDGEPVAVIQFDGGYWEFLGVSTIQSPESG
jgi:hypothetical protein